MKFISWNCRGIGNPRFRRHVKDLYRMQRPDMLCLLETRSCSSVVDDIPVMLGFHNNFRVPSDGFAGGLWVMWNNNGFTALAVGSSSQSIHMCVRENGKATWLLSFCYVRPQRVFKDIFWCDLQEFS